MRQSIFKIYDILQAILPILLMLLGGLGGIYCLATYQTGTVFMVFSLIVLLGGLSMHTYQQVMKSDFFRKRLGIKDKKGSKRHHRAGKRCPQCQHVIYHRRSVCQHCGYQFPSHKQESNSGDKSDGKDVPV